MFGARCLTTRPSGRAYRAPLNSGVRNAMEAKTSPTALAIEWIDKWSLSNATSAANSAASGLDDEVPRENPKLCLDAIVEILNRIPSDPSDHHFQVLAAGPLENLLVYNGEVSVDDIELLARRSTSFRLLLNGVWSPSISSSVLARLEKYRKNPW
jgi:hypothetical protein